MRRLKACGRDGVDMKVVSLLDFTSSMVSADGPGGSSPRGVPGPAPLAFVGDPTTGLRRNQLVYFSDYVFF